MVNLDYYENTSLAFAIEVFFILGTLIPFSIPHFSYYFVSLYRILRLNEKDYEQNDI